jgi:hypothetical protein
MPPTGNSLQEAAMSDTAGAQQGQPGQLQQFLTPEAMLTPGVAGSLTMMIANALAVNFNAPRAWAGLLLSFLFGLLVLVSAKSLLQKSVFYVLNSLVIFCVALGANGLGTTSLRVAAYLQTTQALAQSPGSGDVSKDDLEYCAKLSSAIETAQKDGASGDQIVKLVEPCQNLSRNILTGADSAEDKINPKAAIQGPSKFFAPWRF